MPPQGPAGLTPGGLAPPVKPGPAFRSPRDIRTTGAARGGPAKIDSVSEPTSPRAQTISYPGLGASPARGGIEPVAPRRGARRRHRRPGPAQAAARHGARPSRPLAPEIWIVGTSTRTSTTTASGVSRAPRSRTSAGRSATSSGSASRSGSPTCRSQPDRRHWPRRSSGPRSSSGPRHGDCTTSASRRGPPSR